MASLTPKPGDGYGASFNGEISPQRLTGAVEGFPVPSQPGARTDGLHGGPAAMPTRAKAYAQADRAMRDRADVILNAVQIAHGVKYALGVANLNSLDPNVVWGNARARPFNIQAKAVVLPQNASAAQIAAGAVLAAANFTPATAKFNPISAEDDSQETIVSIGGGVVLTVKLGSNEIAVADSLGITTFSDAAEQELLWTLAYNVKQAPITAVGQPLAPASLKDIMIGQRRGWPFGDADNPAKLQGTARIAPREDSSRGGGQNEINLYVRNSADNSNPAVYIPQPHFVLMTLRGWLVAIDQEGAVRSSTVGAIPTSATGTNQ